MKTNKQTIKEYFKDDNADIILNNATNIRYWYKNNKMYIKYIKINYNNINEEE